MLQNRLHVLTLFLFVCVSSLVSWPSASHGQNERVDDDPLYWMPASTLVYLKLEPIGSLLSHPLRTRIQADETIHALWKSEPLKELRGGIAVSELVLGAKLETLARDLTKFGAHLCINDQGEIVFLSRTRSARWLKDYIQKIVTLARGDNNKNKPGKVAETTYRGIRGYEVNKLIVAQKDDWLLVANKPEIAKATVDQMLDKNKESLDASPFYQRAKEFAERFDSNSNGSIATVYLDLDNIREAKAGWTKKIFSNKPREFVAELLFGGLLATLDKSPMAIGRLALNESGANMEILSPTQPGWFAGTREFYVGPNSKGVAEPTWKTPRGLASLSTYRNLSELWLRAGDLFDQKVNDQLAQVDNTLTTLFSGRDFGTDILGALEPQLQIVSASQFFPNALKPSIRLPSFALVGKLKEPDSMQRDLKRIFQSFVGFLNVAGAMEGQPQLDLESEIVEDAKIYWAEYVVEKDRKYENGLPVQFNFSPSVAFRGDRVVVSSTLALARQLISEIANPIANHDSSLTSPMLNTSVELDLAMIRDALLDNRDQLITQNMLEKGHSKKEAQGEVDVLLGLMQLLGSASGQLSFDEQVRLKIQVDLAGKESVQANLDKSSNGAEAR
ncbi:MAG: hypothetical protein LW870_07655 [Pirellula sp.]|nr:hypothetical protein [Pirellula sp.]